MDKYNGFLYDAAKELNIKIGYREDAVTWKARIIYSILGRMALASLWDREDELISITHFEGRIKELRKAYLKLYPEVGVIFTADSDKLAKEIYNIYLSTGFIYHSPYRIAPVPERVSSGSSIKFIKGANLKRDIFMSGLGTYINSYIEDIRKTYDIEDIFGLQKENIADYSQRIINGADWSKMNNTDNVEYLREEAPFTGGYWKNEPEKDGRVSLLKVNYLGSYSCYLYYYDKGLFVSSLSGWMTNEGEYRRIAVGMIKSRGRLPETLYKRDGDIVKIEINYLFPPSELNFIKLYSWPGNSRVIESKFKRVMQKDVFETIKAYLESIGYIFREG